MNTVLSYLIFVVLIRLNVHYLTASGLSFIVGTLFSYTVNSRYTFYVQRNIWDFTKFFSVTLASLTFGLLLLYVLKSKLDIPVLIAQIFVVIVRFPFVYLLMKFVVFGLKRSS
ncbi:GtrA family protein [Vibrio splendidus]|nr:GtrA family protein [Vibrio splendidus]UOE86016.1 GtrA family protein [Vibrio splendidus]